MTDSHHVARILIEMLLLMILVAFGPGLQAVGPLIIPTFAFLLIKARQVQKWWQPLVQLWIPVSISLFFAFAGSFGSPFETFETVFILPLAVGFALILTLLLCWIAHVERYFVERYPVMRAFVFPVFWCGSMTFLYLVSPLGDFVVIGGPSLGLAVPDYLTVGATWLWGSVTGGAFVNGLLVVLLIEVFERCILSEKEEVEGDRRGGEYQQVGEGSSPLVSNRQNLLALLLISIVFFVACLGGFLQSFALRPDRFFEKSLEEYTPKNFTVACLVGADLHETESYIRNMPAIRADIILWSEATISVNADSSYVFNEKDLLKNAKNLAQKYSVHLGITYTALDGDRKRNKFVLFNNQSEIILSYEKAHPYPFLESKVLPGKRTLPYADTPFGRLGVTVGFDMGFPFINQAAYRNIDVMLHPNRDLSASSELLETHRRLRALENGFHLVSCSAGISGLYDPSLRVLNSQVTYLHEAAVFQVPQMKRRWTFAPSLGVAFGYICIVLLFLPILYEVYKVVRACRKPDQVSLPL